MGVCASLTHNSSTMKSIISSGSTRKQPGSRLGIPPSPVKEKPPIINAIVAAKPQSSPPHSLANSPGFGGSKEETFYDSQAWLESDCEDEFMSVNGDFTPSRGNTPVHHNFRPTAPPVKAVDDQEPSTSTSPSPSKKKKKKRLSELFEESLRDNHEENVEPDDDDDNGVSVDHVAGLKPKRERLVETVHMHSCLPRMLSSCRTVTPQRTQARRK